MFYQEIVHAPGAKDIDQNPIDCGALADRHFRLRDRSLAGDVAGKSPVKVQDVDALVEAFSTDLDELFRRALEPGGVHPAFGMPHRFEALPIAGIPPQYPVVYRFADC